MSYLTFYFTQDFVKIHKSTTAKTNQAKFVTTTFDTLKERYGAVMTLEQLASVLSRKPEGLRMALLKPAEQWAINLNQRKVYIGRRMYFPIDSVASLLDGGVVLSTNQADSQGRKP